MSLKIYASNGAIPNKLFDTNDVRKLTALCKLAVYCLTKKICDQASAGGPRVSKKQ